MAKVHPMPDSRKTLILIGRDGNGKSSIGNAILGEKLFLKNSSTSNEKKLDVKIKGNNEFILFDSNGIGDTDEDMAEDKSSVFDLAKRKIVEKIEPYSLTFILFVLKYGVRFTNQEKKAVAFVKSIFGYDVFRDFVIIAFSYGDLFENQNKDEYNKSFDQWCHEQTGDIKDLFEEVDYRCILFNKHATSHDDSIHLLRRYLDSFPTSPAKRLQVSECGDQDKTQYGTIEKEYVDGDQNCCCCACFRSLLNGMKWFFGWVWTKITTCDCCHCQDKKRSQMYNKMCP